MKYLKKHWKTISIYCIVLFNLFGTGISLYNSYTTREELKNAEYTLNHNTSKDSADYAQQADDKLHIGASRQIIIALEENLPILKENGGENTTDQLDDLLGLYQDIENRYEDDLITEDDVYNNFSYDLEKAWESKEIQTYLKDIRIDDKNLFLGFDMLAQRVYMLDKKPFLKN